MREVHDIVLVHAHAHRAAMGGTERARDALGNVLCIARLGCVQDEHMLRLDGGDYRVRGRRGRGRAEGAWCRHVGCACWTEDEARDSTGRWNGNADLHDLAVEFDSAVAAPPSDVSDNAGHRISAPNQQPRPAAGMAVTFFLFNSTPSLLHSIPVPTWSSSSSLPTGATLRATRTGEREDVQPLQLALTNPY